MNIENNNASELPLMAMDEIPESKPDANEIVALVKDKGKVSGYKLSDGNVVSKEQGISLARQGEIKGVGIANRKGSEYLKSIPDDSENNNLGNLPSISM